MTIELPRESSPKWYRREIPVQNRDVYFVDDDPMVLDVFKKGIQLASGVGARRASFHTTFKTLPSDSFGDSVFVLDNQLRDDDLEGLEWLKKQAQLPEAYLCTSAYDDPAIQNAMKNLGIYLIPKPVIRGVTFTN